MLLPEPDRNGGGYRVYAEDDYQRLCFIRRCRDMGFSLVEIRGLLSLVDGDQVSCEQVKRMADVHLADINRKISDLKQMQSTLRKLSSKLFRRRCATLPRLSKRFSRSRSSAADFY